MSERMGPSRLRGVSLWALSAALASGCSGRKDPDPKPTIAEAAVPDAVIAEAAVPQGKLPLGSGAGAPKAADPRPLCAFEDPRPAPEPFDCPTYSCGNAAMIHSAIVEALDVRGQEVQSLEKPFRLLPETLAGAGGACSGASGLTLGVRNGEFVGTASGEVKCAGAELVGASFKLEQLPSKVSVSLKIAARGTVPTWDPKGAAESLPTYDLVMDGALPQHVCPQASWGAPGGAIPPRNAPPGWSERTYHALLIQGEIYNPDATVARRGAHWFNIGCAGSGISKLRLNGLDPMKDRAPGAPGAPPPGSSTAGERQATLKMLTAKYCGKVSWTRNGTQILFHRGSEGTGPVLIPGIPGLPGTKRAGLVESRWGANGALCVSHLRLWAIGSRCAKEQEAAWVERVQRECNIPACDEKLPCSMKSADADAATVWRTCTVDHQPHALE